MSLKMLGLYLYTLIIGHKLSNMLCLLNKLPLQNELQNCVKSNVFWTKKVKTLQQQNKNSNIKSLPQPEIEPGTSRIKGGCVTYA